MAARDFMVDVSLLDFSSLTADIDTIRKYNLQRHEMEQLTGVVYEDMTEKICVGYKDIGDDEFWARGHMPQLPLMPGVILCEAAAQLASYFTGRHQLLGDPQIVGFGGLEEVRFRDPVFPGCRLIIAVQLLRVRRNRMIVCRFEEMVNDRLVVSGILKGIPLPVDAMREAMQKQNTAGSPPNSAGDSSQPGTAE